MDINQQIKNQAELIKQLNEENEKLKEEIKILTLDFEFYKNDYNDSLNKARKLIKESNEAVSIYNSLIEETKTIKEQCIAQYNEYYVLKEELKRILEKLN